MLAVLMAFIAMASIGAVVFSAMVANKNQGTETTRMTVMAQEKIEQLLRLTYRSTDSPAPCAYTTEDSGATCIDKTTNTTLITNTSWNVGITTNDGTTLSQLSTCPASDANVGYVDWLDANGVPLAGACEAVIAQTYAYVRRWKIATVLDSSSNVIPNLKQITVVVYAPNAVKAGQASPTVAMTSFKAR